MLERRRDHADPSVRRFRGSIAGLGSTSGVRIVVGWWRESPYGAFADVMLAEPDGTRVLLAPTDEVARFVSGTYRFDRVEIVPVDVGGAAAFGGPAGLLGGRAESRPPVRVHVSAGDLDLTYDVGRRTPLGLALRAVPPRLAESPAWSRVTDPVARAVLTGVRTRGSAGGGRVETYGATDVHRVEALHGSWRGRDLGDVAPVSPDPGFGFGSTPERPSVTTLVTTVVG